MQKPTITKVKPLQFFLLLACGVVTGAHAQGVLIDQSLQPPPYIPGESYHYDAAIGSLVPGTGQEFTPALPALDFVDVTLYGNAGTFQIALHEGNLAAPILGLSDQGVSSAGGFPGNEAHFAFPGTVPLIAGNLYVLEVIQLGGYSGWGIEIPSYAIVNGQTIDMNCPGGRLIYGGVLQDNSDMLFREGIIVPEPGVAALCLLGVLAFGLVRHAYSTSAARRGCALRLAGAQGYG